MKYPTDTQCPVCGKVFKQPRRPQGGGRRSIFCSHNCTAKSWARGNPAKRKASIRKWEEAPQNQAKIRAKRLKDRFAKYGMTVREFNALLERQHERCAGCSTKIDLTAHVDHSHATNKVRGLLCGRCNHALGHVKESAATLYQLAAYLELDRTRPVIYLIGSLRNPNVVLLGNDIRALDYEVVDNWVAAGDQADNAWRDYSKARGRTYQEALKSREAQHIFNFDRAYLHLSDRVVLVYPAGTSAHLEFGYAVSLGKPGYLLMETPTDRYDVMLQFAGSPLFHDKELLLAALKEERL